MKALTRRGARRAATLLGLTIFMSACGIADSLNGGGAAADFPTDDLRLTVPFSAGGGFDAQARAIAPYLEKHLPGSPTVIVDNQPGGDGLQAIQQVYSAEPDGHTLVQVGLSSAVIQQFVNPDLVRYDVSEFNWIGRYQQDIRGLAVDPALGIESWDDLMALAQERPIRFGGAGAGSPPSSEAVAISQLLDFPSEVIEYPGSNEVLGAFIRDEADAVVLNYTSLVPWQEAGDADILLLWSEERVKRIPDVPTAVEAGVPQEDFDRLMGLPLIGTARAFAAPPGTPEEHVEILREAFAAAMEDQEFVAYTEEPNTDLIYAPMGGEEFAKQVRKQMSAVEENLDLISELYG